MSFGGTPASSFVVNSDTQITAVVGSSTAVTGGQQLVIVTAPAGTFSLGGFSLGGTAQSGGTAPTGNTAPQSAVISGFSPQSLAFGTPITLSGSGFTGATGLLIGGVPVTNFVVVNDNTITAIVGGVPVNERVQLTGGLGASLDMSGLGLTYSRLPSPVIASVSLASLSASGDDAALTLSGFNFLTGARVLVREQNADVTTAVAVSSSTMTATQAAMTLPGVLRSPGTKTIILVNPDGQSGSITLTVVTGAAVQIAANDGQPFVFTTTASGRAFSIRLSGANIFRTVQAFIGSLQARVSVPSSTEAIVEVPASVNEIGGVSLTLRLQNSDGQSTSATVRIERRPPPTIIAVTLQSGGRLRVRGVNFLSGIRAALSNSALTVLSQDGDTACTAQIPTTFRLMSNTPTVSLTVENSDGRAHGVLLPRSFFDGQIAGASEGNAVTTERRWENNSVGNPVEVVAEKHMQSASQELSIYPNPMETELRIGGVGQRTVRVYDMRGSVVVEDRTTSGSVNVAGLSAGVYIVVVESADGRILRQRVVKR
ncbi:MAG: IPT/TIG domain-containing protein [Ignavibacteria bacterium]|nr:IPT/TIG domain-containing protein [Ignavibacteria bacterium]